MAKRPPKKTQRSTAGKAPRKTPTPLPPATGIGWKAPLALALLITGAAGASIYYKVQSGGRSDTGSPLASTAAAQSFPDNTGPEAGYVGSSSCGECHEGITESYSHIAMGRSLYRPAPDNIIEDYETNNVYYHKPSDQYFRMTHENGRFYQARFQKDPSGRFINEKKVEISYVVGSGNNSRSYIHREPDGKMYQLPIAWYSEDHKWGMNPGYDNERHISFSRRITYDCLFCHAAYPDLPAGADQYNYGESSWFPDDLEAINCERCHGPAAEHVKLAKGGAAETAIRESILNPASLDNQLQLELCMQCHLETTSGNLPHSVHTVNKGIFGYRPGEPLAEYRHAFDHPPGTGHDDKFEIAGQAYRMMMSPCFTESKGKMTCTTCHDPHRVPIDRIEAGIQSCMECHAPADCTESMDVRMPVKDNCIQCHMPQRRTDDVVNVVMTDHFIQRRPPPPEELLAPRKEHSGEYRGDVMPYYPKEIAPEVRDLYLGLAHIANSADLPKGLAHLEAYLKAHPDEFAAVYTKGVALKMLGQLDRARSDLERSVQMKPDHPQAWMALGDLFEMMRNFDRSVECYKRAQLISPKLSRAYNGAGTSYLLSGNHAAAEAEFRKAITHDPFDENPHLNLAGIYLQRGDYSAAEAEARAALAITPTSAAGWLHLAQCSLEGSRAGEAIWTSLESLQLNPASSEAFEVLIAACRETGPHAAGRSLESAQNRAPFASLVAQALLYTELGDMTGAADALTSAAQTTTIPAALPSAVLAALVADRHAYALPWGEQAVAALPGNDEAIIRFAAALSATDQHGRAESLLMDFAKNHRSPRVLNALAWLKATSSNPTHRNGAEAYRYAEEAAKMLSQPNVFIMQSQAAAAAEVGEFEAARAIANEALKMAQGASLNLEARRIQVQITDYQAGRPHYADW